MKHLLTIRALPMPPSLNQCYRTLPNHGRAATKELKDFKAEMTTHGWVVKPGMLKPCKFYALELTFYFPHGKLHNKDGKTKRLDVSNRCKPMEDALADLLQVDDRHFWDVSVRKRVLSTGDIAYVVAKIYGGDVIYDLPPSLDDARLGS